MQDTLTIAGKSYQSRLLVGTGKYKSLEETQASIQASGAEIITVALRRMPLGSEAAEHLQTILPPDRYTYLPNSAGCLHGRRSSAHLNACT